MFAVEHLWRWTADPVYLDYIRKYTGVIRSYEEYIAQPREISTFAEYGSFILGTGVYEHRIGRISQDFQATDNR